MNYYHYAEFRLEILIVTVSIVVEQNTFYPSSKSTTGISCAECVTGVRVLAGVEKDEVISINEECSRITRSSYLMDIRSRNGIHYEELTIAFSCLFFMR